jgi:hypothetical protein
MAKTNLKYAQLDESGLQKVLAMEEATGSVVLVVEKIHPLAKLSEMQVKKIQDLEKELGVILLAYQPM